MHLNELEGKIPPKFHAVLRAEGIAELRPAQEKAIKGGLLKDKNLLVCTPTSSGKTLVAELCMLNIILAGKGKALYIVPLKALGTEKYNDFKRKYDGIARVAISIGDFDTSDPKLIDYDLIICTAEKLDSLIRHRAPWLSKVGVVVIDEIHLINDNDRGPTLEVLITLLRTLIRDVQIVALSATIGNPHELAAWLDAGLIEDGWRPVKLSKGVYLNGDLSFDD